MKKSNLVVPPRTTPLQILANDRFGKTIGREDTAQRYIEHCVHRMFQHGKEDNRLANPISVIGGGPGKPHLFVRPASSIFQDRERLT